MNAPVKTPTVIATSTATPDKHCLVCLFHRSYRLFVNVAACLQSPLLLAIRLYWGWQFFLTGKGKLMNLERTSNFFLSLHIPLPHLNAWVVGVTECVGGLLLLTGLGTRLVGALLAFDMIVAYLTADIETVKHIVDNPDKFLGADPFLFMLASIIVLAFGSGRFSIDWLIGRNLLPKDQDSPNVTKS